MALLAACLVLVAVMAVQAWYAAREVAAARAQAPALVQALIGGDRPAALRDLTQMRRRADAARRATHGVSWRVAGYLPLVGRTAAAVSSLTGTVDNVVQLTAPALLDGVDALDLRHLQPGSVNLQALAAADAPLSRAVCALAPLVPAESRAGVLPPIAGAQRHLRLDLLRLLSGLRHASDAARLLPNALGADGTRRYFVAFQGSAEARGTGGLIGAYGVVQATSGRLSMAVVGTDRDLRDLPTSTRALGPEYSALYGRDPELWANSNVSPHFPYAARLWLDKWQAQTGQRLDGAVATDTTALSYLLLAIGPVRLPGGELVAGGGVVAATEQQAYSRFAGRQTERKAYLVGLANAVVKHVLHGDGRPGDVAAAMARAAGEGRLQVFSRHPGEQAALDGTQLAGELPDSPAPYAAVVVNNAAGNKLDYYLRRSVEYALEPCMGGRRTSRVRVVLGNDVPDGPLPEYVSGRGDLVGVRDWQRGSTKLHLALYATRGARLVSATVDGAAAEVRGGSELGHPVFLLAVELGRGAQRTVVLTLQEPARAEAARAPAQPLVRPQQTVVRDQPCRVSARR
jgi:hypothetical protein